MTKLDWIAVDWGTTHLRAWAMGVDNKPLNEAMSDQGMRALEALNFEAALLDLVGDWLGDVSTTLDVLACGMVGSRQGWVEAKYRPVPCKALGDAHTIAPSDKLKVLIVSGLRQDKPTADVMRGEETQIAGFLAGDKEFDGVLCLPGSHTKWARVSAEEVVSFQTCMTGELFAAVSQHTVLRHSLADSKAWNDEIFLEAVEEGMSHPARLSSRLFSLRAEGLLHGLSAADVRARLSGLLIGMELAATKPYWLGQRISVIGEADLSALYVKALSEQGCLPVLEDGDAMTLKGLIAARTAMKGS